MQTFDPGDIVILKNVRNKDFPHVEKFNGETVELVKFEGPSAHVPSDMFDWWIIKHPTDGLMEARQITFVKLPPSNESVNAICGYVPPQRRAKVVLL